MSARRRRWLTVLLAVAILVAGGMWISYRVILPGIVRSEVAAGLARLGFADVSFELRSATLWETDLANVREGNGESLRASGIEVRYSPRDAIAGKLETITLTGARLTLDLDRPRVIPSAASDSAVPADLPFARLDLRSCILLLQRRGRALEIPVDGSLERKSSGPAELKLASSISSAPLSVVGSIDVRGGAIDLTADAAGVPVSVLRDLLPRELLRTIDSAGGTITCSLHFTRTDGQNRATLHIAMADLALTTVPDVGVAISGLDGSIEFTDLLGLTTAPRQILTIDRVTLSDQQLTDGLLSIQLAGPHALRVAHLQFDWAGGEVRADPFTLDPSHPVIDTTVIAQHVGLKQAVALVSGGRATGDGTVSGAVPIRVDWPSVEFGDGALRADAPGNLRLGDASTKFGDLLEKSNPGFASDPTLKELKGDVLDAVQNFDFKLLEVRFHKTDGEQNALIRLHGRGNTGRRVPINLNFNVSGIDQALDAYLQTRSSVFSRVSGKVNEP